MTRWRQRMGEDKLVALIQESPSAATRVGAAKPRTSPRVIVDTTVQPGGGVPDRRQAHAPSARAAGPARQDAWRSVAPLLRAGGEEGANGLPALAHAKQFKRANRALVRCELFW